MTVHPLISSTQRAARPLSLICDVAFGVPSLSIPDDFWMSCGDGPEDAAGDRLLASVTINGVPFMADARAVTDVVSGGYDLQSFEDDGAVDEFTGEVDAVYSQVTIRGRQYVLVLTPHVEG